jgi:protein farnesyltransferase subunit beta
MSCLASLLFDAVSRFPLPCDTQTYEGGIGGEPGNEAHGGYTYCGLAAVALAGCPQALDLSRLLHWAVQRQGWVEGGFNGRTNKLVDGCYSFWQGGVFPILQQLMQQELPQQVSQVFGPQSYLTDVICC